MKKRATTEPAAPPANEIRGEVSITLDGSKFVLRPSYEAILGFEKATGKSLIELARAASSGSLSVTDAAAIVTGCIQAWGKATENSAASGVNAKRIGELLIEGSMLLVLKRLELLLFIAATGGVTSTGEMKAPATMATATEQTQGAA